MCQFKLPCPWSLIPSDNAQTHFDFTKMGLRIRVSKISINFQFRNRDQFRNSFSISELISELCFYWKMHIFTWYWQNPVMFWYCKGSQKSLLINFSTKLTYFHFYFSKNFTSWKSVHGKLSKTPRFYPNLANFGC